MATITIYVPDQEPLELALDGYEQVTIGRGPENDIVLEHVSISGSHAILFNIGGTYQLQDLNSTNGTFLNGVPVTETVLSNGSRINFGNVEAVFQDEAAVEDTFGTDSGGSGYASGHLADIAEVSNRPAGFVNLSPIEKIVKKNTLGLVATIVGAIAILAAIALVALSAMMKAA